MCVVMGTFLLMVQIIFFDDSKKDDRDSFMDIFHKKKPNDKKEVSMQSENKAD